MGKDHHTPSSQSPGSRDTRPLAAGTHHVMSLGTESSLFHQLKDTKRVLYTALGARRALQP